MSYTFFPGCSLEGTAKDFHSSTLAVSGQAGPGHARDQGWICCGSTAAHKTDPLLADGAAGQEPAGRRGQDRRGGLRRLLQPAEDRQPPHRRRSGGARRGGPGGRQATTTGRRRFGTCWRSSARDIGTQKIAAAVRRPLTGLKVACYYGCLLSRPPEVTQFDDAENPTLMDQRPGGRRGNRARLAAQDRVLRRELSPSPTRHRPGAHRPDPGHGQGRRRGLHRHRLPAVPAQPGHAAEGHRGQARPAVRPAGLLFHATARPGHGLLARGACRCAAWWWTQAAAGRSRNRRQGQDHRANRDQRPWIISRMVQPDLPRPAAKSPEAVGAVMVCGAGITGIQASLDLAESGFKVYLVDPRRPSAAAWPNSTRPSPPATAPCASCRPSWWSARATRTSRSSRWPMSRGSPASRAISR